MTRRLFPMANLSINQIDKDNPLKSLKKLYMGFGKPPANQGGYSTKTQDKIRKEAELLTTLRIFHRNKLENIKLKSKNKLIKLRRKKMLETEDNSSISIIKTFQMTKVKEELDEIDTLVNLILNHNTRLSKDIEHFKEKQKKLKFKKEERKLNTCFRHVIYNRNRCPKYLKKKEE